MKHILKKIINYILSTENLNNETLKLIAEDFPFRTVPPRPTSNATEPNVATPLKFLINPGEIFFDVGAHIGSISEIASELVGPNGQVISFEANPSTIRNLTANMVKNHRINVHIFNYAIWKLSGQLMKFENNGAASSIVINDKEDCLEIKSISIDDFVQKYKIYPNFIKMDIEGFEYEALLGAINTIRNCRPLLIIEHNLGDDRALNFLKEHGHVLIDTSTWKQISSSADCDPLSNHTNVLAISNQHQEILSQFLNLKLREIGNWKGVEKFELVCEPGIYFLEYNFELNQNQTIWTSVSFNKEVISKLQTEGFFFQRNHRRISFLAEFGGIYQGEIGGLPKKSKHGLEIKAYQLSFN
jgi:FkbM family methyltransferase